MATLLTAGGLAQQANFSSQQVVVRTLIFSISLADAPRKPSSVAFYIVFNAPQYYTNESEAFLGHSENKIFLRNFCHFSMLQLDIFFSISLKN